ncbi:MAG: c-type cytochrome [Terracidiphilus sp.]
MKTTSLLIAAASTGLLAAAIYVADATAQAPQNPPPSDQPAATAPQNQAPEGGAPGERQMRNYPPPTNLQVLPKNLSGREVREIMETWSGSLGVHCNFCHVADPKNVGPNGRPRMNFADDAKPDKKIARIMYSMTQQINKDYVSKAMDLDTDDMGSPVTCGTCHRGHEMPEEFVVPRDEHHGGPGGEGAGAPPAASGAPPAN